MKAYKVFATTTLMLISMQLCTPFAQAQETATASTGAASSTNELSEGVVIKKDMSTGKITLKHGPIKNLDMPGMSMVFRVKDVAMIDRLAIGDKVRFRAAKVNGAIYLTELETSQP